MNKTLQNAEGNLRKTEIFIPQKTLPSQERFEGREPATLVLAFVLGNVYCYISSVLISPR